MGFLPVRRSLCIALFSLLLCFGWASDGFAAQSLQRVDLQLRWHHQFQFAGYYAAVARGFYQEEGLDVRLHEGDPSHQPVEEMLSGRAQYASSNGEVLLQRLKGKPFVALAAIFQHSALQLMVREDSGIRTPHDLIGKKVALLNVTDDADILTMFLNEGISLDSVHIVPSSYDLNDLIKGHFDAYNVYITNEPYVLDQLHIPYNTIDPKNYGVDFYSDILFTTEAELRDHPARVEAIRRATLKGWDYATAHPDEIIDLLINQYHVKKTRAHLEFEAAEMRKLILPDLVEMGHMNVGRWQYMADSFVKVGLVKPGYTLDGFIYDPSPKHLPVWVFQVLLAALGMLVIISFTVFHLLRLNRKLAKTKGNLNRSAEQLRLALVAARQGWFDLNVVTGEVAVSEEYPKLLGYDPGQFHSSLREWQDSLHPDDREAVLAAFSVCLMQGGPVSMVYRKYKRDGSWIWLQSVGEIVEWDAKHQPLRMVGIHTDITERKIAEEQRQRSESHLRAILESTSACVTIIGEDGTLLSINSAGLALLEADSTNQLLSQSIYPIVAPDYLEVFRAFNKRVCAGVSGSLEFEIIGCKGTHRWIQMHAVPFQSEPEAAWDQLAFAEDITWRKQNEFELELAASVFTHAREGIVITDADGNMIKTNDTFTRITGYSREEALGQNPRMLKSNRHNAEFYLTMWQDLLENGYWSGEVWNRRKNGEVYAQLLTISAVYDDQDKLRNYLGIFTDITRMKQYQSQLELIAHFDPLTGLPNRILLADRLKQAQLQCQRHSRAMAVLFLDLDGFKIVNDTYGHEMGDRLLVAISQRMQQTMREDDTLSRIGGDEFVAVLVDLVHQADCEPLLARLLKSVSDPVRVNNVELNISVSIGVTFYPDDKSDADMMIRHADQAMYMAKQTGKNRYHVFDPAHDAAVQSLHESLAKIRRALYAHELVLHYQPKVNMRTGALVGLEALIRWQHPDRGLLFPDMFLPIVEDHPLSVELGEWVIDTALAQISQWQAAGLNLPVSVNIGAEQLQQPDFMQRLSAQLAMHPDVPPGFIKLEVLETSALEDVIKVSAVMRSCAELGVHFALDDFGVGYSSLTYLKRLPARELKIDRSFISDMLENPDDMAIVKSIVSLAAAFNREVIAEGVETRACGALLLELGCELAQGNGIASPMAADAVPDWLVKWNDSANWAAK